MLILAENQGLQIKTINIPFYGHWDRRNSSRGGKCGATKLIYTLLVWQESNIYGCNPSLLQVLQIASNF